MSSYLMNVVDSGSRDKNWIITCETEGSVFTSTCEYLVIATGHHAKPKIPKFNGEENFKGNVYNVSSFAEFCQLGAWLPIILLHILSSFCKSGISKNELK